MSNEYARKQGREARIRRLVMTHVVNCATGALASELSRPGLPAAL